MRSKTWALLLCLHCVAIVSMAAIAVMAQNPAKRQLVLPISDGGGFVAFRSETSGNAPAAASRSLSALLFSQAFAGEDRIIHRVLTDSDKRVVFAYDLAVSSDAVTKKFRLVVLPADEAFRRSFLKDNAPLRAHESFATFPRSTAPQTLDDGDAVSLELLVNRESGVKIVDVVKVTFDRSILRENYLEAAPKDFTIDAGSLAIKSYELSIDGVLIGKSKSKLGCTGSLLWFYVPDRGRFILSLLPRDGYSFEKIGMVDGNRIEFILNGELYEWASSETIFPNGGAWNLWVLHDPNYEPLFMPKRNPPPPVGSQKGPSVFEKLEDKFLTRQGISLIRNIGESKAMGKPSIDSPQRVMIGGADSMENLLPKIP